jgi:hypothetical protein
MINNTLLRNIFLIAFLLIIVVLHSCARGESRRENDPNDSIRVEQQRREALERANRLLEEGEMENSAEEPDSLK